MTFLKTLAELNNSARDIHKDMKELLNLARLIRIFIMIICISACSMIFYETPSRLLARVQGYKLIAEPILINAGLLEAGQMFKAQYRIINISGETLTISDAKTSCDCVKIEPEFPKVLKSGDNFEVIFLMKIPANTGPLQREVILWSENSMESLLCLRMNGVVSTKE